MALPTLRHFGTDTGGCAVDKITLTAGDITVSLLTWGAVVQGVWLTGPRGQSHNLTPGSDRLSDYVGQMRHHGSLIGPVVDRLTDATAPINGKDHRFEANLDNRHTLHSGQAGTHLKVWDLLEAGRDHATLALTLPDGEGGFPGNRRITARYSVAAPATLRLDLSATTDAPTLMNPANHSYWNLDGTACWAGHSLRVAADHHLPTTKDFRPTGEIRAVAGTEYDFRRARVIARGRHCWTPPFALALRAVRYAMCCG